MLPAGHLLSAVVAKLLPARYSCFLWLGGEIWYLVGGLALVTVVCCFLFSWKLGKFSLGCTSLRMCQGPEGTKQTCWPWQASFGASTPHPLPVGSGLYFSFSPCLSSVGGILISIICLAHPPVWSGSEAAGWFPGLTPTLPYFYRPVSWSLDLFLTYICWLTKWLDLPHHHDTALRSGLLVVPGYHLLFCPVHLAWVQWDWALTVEAPDLPALWSI